MKKQLLFLFLFLSESAHYKTQTVISFQHLDSAHIRLEQLDPVYKSALHQDTTQSVFNHQTTRFINCYTQLVQELGQFQKKNGFVLSKPLNYFHRLYFKDGKLDYYIYKFPPNSITSEQEEIFIKNCTSFFKDYQFPMKSATPFAQCCKVQLY